MSDDEDLRPATAFRISINGEPYCETEDLTALTLVVDDVRRRAHQRITLYATANEGPLQWMTSDLGAGDQIVIEIVDAVAERESEPEHCDFCGRDVSEVSTLVLGKSGNICNQCITAFSNAVHEGRALPVGATLRDDSEWICRFCGKGPPAISGVVVRNGAAVCAECLRTCADIQAEHTQ